MKYAIVVSGGKQFKAVEGGTIEVDRLAVEAGDPVSLDQVLAIGRRRFHPCRHTKCEFRCGKRHSG